VLSVCESTDDMRVARHEAGSLKQFVFISSEHKNFEIYSTSAAVPKSNRWVEGKLLIMKKLDRVLCRLLDSGVGSCGIISRSSDGWNRLCTGPGVRGRLC